MCIHFFKFYQIHSFSSLKVVPANENLSKFYSIELRFPSCSVKAGIHHKRSSASPLYREFSAIQGRHDLPIEVNIFNLFRGQTFLEWKV